MRELLLKGQTHGEIVRHAEQAFGFRPILVQAMELVNEGQVDLKDAQKPSSISRKRTIKSAGRNKRSGKALKWEDDWTPFGREYETIDHFLAVPDRAQPCWHNQRPKPG